MSMLGSGYKILAVIHALFGMALCGLGAIMMTMPDVTGVVMWSNIGLIFIVSGVLNVITFYVLITRKMIV